MNLRQVTHWDRRRLACKGVTKQVSLFSDQSFSATPWQAISLTTKASHWDRRRLACKGVTKQVSLFSDQSLLQLPGRRDACGPSEELAFGRQIMSGRRGPTSSRMQAENSVEV